MQNILITGITGQDGIFLVDRLMKSYSDINILGVSRNKDQENFSKKLSTSLECLDNFLFFGFI